MRSLLLFALACGWAAFMPLAADPPDPGSAAETDAARWPAAWEGASLRPLPLTPEERRFTGAFPGSIARFTDGSREVLFRRVARPTRKLHPAADCLRAGGYAVAPLPAEAGPSGTWSRSRAVRGGVELEVKELVMDADGRTWPDIPSWYWQAFWGRTRGPWTAVTVSRLTAKAETGKAPPAGSGAPRKPGRVSR